MLPSGWGKAELPGRSAEPAPNGEPGIISDRGTRSSCKASECRLVRCCSVPAQGPWEDAVGAETATAGSLARVRTNQSTSTPKAVLPRRAGTYRAGQFFRKYADGDWEDNSICQFVTLALWTAAKHEVPVRELHRSYFMLRPEFKLGMNGNYQPRIDGGEKDSGMWRRLKLVPWRQTIPADKRDKNFGALLKAEAAGILNRMLAGLERWMRKGLVDPKEVEEATEQFRQQSDPLGRFLLQLFS